MKKMKTNGWLAGSILLAASMLASQAWAGSLTIMVPADESVTVDIAQDSYPVQGLSQDLVQDIYWFNKKNGSGGHFSAPSGNWSTNLALEYGLNTFTFSTVGEDADGNTEAIVTNRYIQRGEYELNVINPPNEQYYDRTQDVITVSGTSKGLNGNITWNNSNGGDSGTIIPAVDGNWSGPVTIELGENRITFSATGFDGESYEWVLTVFRGGGECSGSAESYRAYAQAHGWIDGDGNYITDREPGDDPDGDGLDNETEFYGWESTVNAVKQGYSYLRGSDLTACGPAFNNADSDGDGLSDWAESKSLTNPHSWDTDGDGMNDAWEVYVGLDPCDDGTVNLLNAVDADPDGDGLDNIDEYNTLIAPGSWSVASASNPDGSLIAHQMVPTFTNGYYTYPLYYDSDNDSLLDSYEHESCKHSNLKANRFDEKDDDYDLDGLSNFREQCIHPLLAIFWFYGKLPDSDPNANRLDIKSEPLNMNFDKSVDGLTVVYDRRALVVPGYLRDAQLDIPWNVGLLGNAAPAGLPFPYDLGPGNVIWGSPNQRWGICDDWDSDSDTLPDGWELEHGLNLRSGSILAAGGYFNPSGELGDPDADTRVNRDEYRGQDGYRVDFVTGSGDETTPWLTRVLNDKVSSVFASGVGQLAFGHRQFQAPMNYLVASFSTSFDPAGPRGLLGFFDPEELAAGNYVPIAGATPIVALWDLFVDGTFSRFNPLATSIGGVVFRDAPGHEDGVFTPGFDDAWQDNDGDGIFTFGIDYIYVDNTSLAGGEQMTGFPTVNIPSKWPMPGMDTDDDGISDKDEIEKDLEKLKYPTSPVNSLNPFNPKAIRIMDGSGLALQPAGTNVDMVVTKGDEVSRPMCRYFARDFTIECWVYLTDNGTNDYQGTFIEGRVRHTDTLAYALGVERYTTTQGDVRYSVPYVEFETLGGTPWKVRALRTLPLNRWVHIAGVFSHTENALSLYIDGLLEQSRQVQDESSSSWGIEHGGTVWMAKDSGSGDSFAGQLWLDEVRIWGLPRTSDEVADNRDHIVEPYQKAEFSKYPGLFTISTQVTYIVTNEMQVVTNEVSGTNGTEVVIATNSVTVTNSIYTYSTNEVINTLFSYYTFDDGGRTAEDFTKRAKCSLLGNDYPADVDIVTEPRQEYFYGDTLYTIEAQHITETGTNELFRFDETRRAPVIGMLDPEQGSIDSDGDLLPDGWELIMEFNPFKKMTPAHGELGLYDLIWTQTGTVLDPETDPDEDGLTTIYEYWARTNPRKNDSDENGVPDANEDFDKDGLPNRLEVTYATRPDLADTDDDQYTDGYEQKNNTKPNDALSPERNISAVFDGLAGSWLDIPTRSDLRLENYTIEARILPSTAMTNVLADGMGAVILRKVDQITENDLMAVNYELRIVRKGSYFTPEILYISVDTDGNGTINAVTGDPKNNRLDRLPMDMFQNLGGTFVNLAATYNYTNGALRLYMDGRLVGSKSISTNRPPLTGQGPKSFIRIGERFAGSIDRVRVWDKALDSTVITSNTSVQYSGPVSNLVANFRFDDGGYPVHAIYESAQAILSTPPPAPSASIRYLVGPAAVTNWSGKDGQIAEYNGAEWTYVVPEDAGQICLASGIWYYYDSATKSWAAMSSVLPAVKYSVQPVAPEPGDTWLSNHHIVTYESGVIYTSPVAYGKVFGEGGMLEGNANTGDFAFYEQKDLYYRNIDNGSSTVWWRWGSNPQCLDGAMSEVKATYVTVAAMLAVRTDSNTAVGDAFLVKTPVPYVYEYKAGGAVGDAASYLRKPIYAGTRVLDMATTEVLDYDGSSFFAVADATTDGGDLYIVINNLGVAYKSDGTKWQRWGFVPTFQEFTVTNGWMTQWSKSARVCGNVKTGTKGQSNSSGSSGDDPIDPTDTDNDGMPDAWEMQYFGNLDQGPTGDPDGDGLQNIYEYLAGTDPTVIYSNIDSGLTDYLYDSDNDGLSNGEEQQRETNPGNRDSDDDGMSDYDEIESILSYPHTGNWKPPRSPLYSMGAYAPSNFSFAITCSQFPGNGVDVPDGPSDNPSAPLTDWTIETWFYSDSMNSQDGILIGKYIGGKQAFALGVKNGKPYAGFDYQTGVYTNHQEVPAAATLPSSEWCHLAATWNSAERSLSLYINGTMLHRKSWEEESWVPVSGVGVVSLAISEGNGFSGNTFMDNIRIWKVARSLSENDASRQVLLDAERESGLMRCFRFDDGGSTVEDFAHPLNVATDSKNKEYVLNPATYGIKFGAGGQIAWLSTETYSPFYDAEQIDGEYIPAWWLSVYQVTNSNTDVDGDGLSNLYEYMGKTDPTKKYSYNGIFDPDYPGTPSTLTLLDEQTYFSDPRYPDTDGDGTLDDDEIGINSLYDEEYWPISDPALALQNNNNAANPQINRYSVQVGSGQYLTLQTNGTPGKYALKDWTIEAWVYPQSIGYGSLVKRQVQAAADGGEMLNYHLGVTNSSGVIYPFISYIGKDFSGVIQPELMVGGSADVITFGDYSIPTGQWSHVAGRFNSASNLMTLFVNGRPVADNSSLASGQRVDSPEGGHSIADLRIGEGFPGLIDEVKIWGAALDDNSLYTSFRSTGGGKFGGYDIGENGTPTNSPATWINSVAAAQDADVVYATNQILVKFKSHLTDGVREALMNQFNAHSIQRYELIDVNLLEIADGVNLSDALAALQGSPEVEYAELNVRREVNRVPNDPEFSDLWAMQNTGQNGGTAGADISAVAAWDKTIGSRDVVVAVIDTGIDYEHEDISANMWVNENEIPNNNIDDDGNGYIDDYYGYDFGNDDGDPMDVYGHGTHCAGTIGAIGNNGVGVAGVNWNVKLMAVKAGTDDGYLWVSDELLAIEYAVKMGAKISNNSYGGFGFVQSEYDAIKAAGEQGHLFVASAGNSGIDIDDFFWPYTPGGYDLDNIICVGASDRNDAMPYWSNYGEESVDLMAPGAMILSTVPSNNYAYYSGTSMSTPHVVGVAAMLKALNDSMHYLDIKESILNGVDGISIMEGKSVTGGRLNAENSLSGVGGMVAYFRMDDGGMIGTNAFAQDMAVVNDNVFGWRSSVRLMGGAVYEDANYAQMTGDSDNDDMPDWFETAYQVIDPDADEDGDGLENLYEYYAGTNPRQVDTLFDGFSDDQRDSDNDGLLNGTEQVIGCDAGLPDTDDDGMKDGDEVKQFASPIISLFPTNNLALEFDGSAGAELYLPDQPRFALDTDWTVEGWVRPDAAELDGGLLLERSVGPAGYNYGLELIPQNGELYAAAYVADINGNLRELVQPTNTPAIKWESWSHVAATYDKTTSEFCLYVNGACVEKQNATYIHPAANEPGKVWGVIGSGFDGRIDEVRIWSKAQSASNLVALMYPALVGNEGGLVAYYRFDDGTSYRVSPFKGTSRGDDVNRFSVGQVEDFVTRYKQDWNSDWFNGASFDSVGIQFVPNATLPVIETDSDGDGLPDWWEYYYFGNLNTSNGTEDQDGDGIIDRDEYEAGTNPMNPYSFGGAITDAGIDSDNDGLSNVQEQDEYGTDPGKADTDNDGVKDGIEVQNLTNPLHPMSVYNVDKRLRNMAHPRSLDLAALSSGGVELPAPERFDFVMTNGWTIELWFNMGSDANGSFFLYESRESDTISFDLYNGTPYGLIIGRSGGTTNVMVGGPLMQGQGLIPLPQQRWIHLALVWDPENQTFAIYRNGEQLVANQTNYKPASGSGRAYIARDFSDGYIDEMRVWKRARRKRK